MSDSFVDSLRELDDEFQQQQLSAEADARILAAIQTASKNTAPDTPWWLTWYLPVAVSCLALVFGGVLHFSITPKGAQMGGFWAMGGAYTFSHQGALQCESPLCQLRVPARYVRVQAQKQTQLSRRKRDIQLVKGNASFWVGKQTPAMGPLRIYVSHGYIEVLGTHFTLTQGADGGHIALHHGKVRFVSSKGHERLLNTGQSLRWPLEGVLQRPSQRSAFAPTPRPTQHIAVKPQGRRMVRALPALRRLPDASAPSLDKGSSLGQTATKAATGPLPIAIATPPDTKAPPQAGPVSPTNTALPPVRRPAVSRRLPVHRVAPPVRLAQPVLQLLEEIERLRSQGHFAQAAALLVVACQKMRPQGPSAAYERLHYELGQLLAFQLKKKRKACLHWRDHLRLFSSSHRYASDIRASLRQLRCP